MTPTQVIALNNCAVALIKQQHYRDAIVAAASALKQYREFQRAHHQTEEVQQQRATTTNCHEGDSIDQYMMQSDISEPSFNASTGEFVYQRGIFIPPNAYETINIAAILIFNSALSHQLLARQHPKTPVPQSILLKAQRLYQLAYDLQDNEDNILFKFAVINNTAVIYRAVGNHTMSKECLDFLVSLLMMFVDRGCSVQLQHVRGFLANLDSNTQSAPAA
ncbi:unnamed protein product [Cylindrotheca closterium]|uniref:Uncharacterized protein n=1 Tax=Cylindrotheca closterium TaxID=2856 RepID=A0AAD2FPP6_9STRA|nr:unnamed protein product [Cylindrotheca closterium]